MTEIPVSYQYATTNIHDRMIGRINMLTRLFIDGRFYDPAYRERTWLRSLRRIWRRR